MCNVPLGGGRRPYGQDALVAGPIHEYEVSPDYSPSPEHQPAPRFYEREEGEQTCLCCIQHEHILSQRIDNGEEKSSEAAASQSWEKRLTVEFSKHQRVMVCAILR